MSAFDFNEVKESKSFVGYGVTNDVTIISVENGLSSNGKPFIQINLKKTGDSDEDSTIQKVYMSEAAKNISMIKLMAIHSAVSTIERLKSKPFANLDELTAGLNAMWSGRRLRIKLQASEWLGEDKEGNPRIRTRTELPIRDFVEAIEGGADMPIVADADTKLVFDETNEHDFKRYKGERPIDGGADAAKDSTKEDLPW